MTARGHGLNIWLGGDHVGVLSRRRTGDLEIAYLEYVVSDLGVGAICLSVSLPVRDDAYTGAAAQRWLEGVVPEGETRTVLEDRFDIARGDTFGLLAVIGRDCAGAVSFIPDGEEPRVSDAQVFLDDDDLAQAIEDLPVSPLGASEDVPVSLGGLQAKLLLCKTDRGWAHSTRGIPSTHILKPASFVYPGLVAAEALTLDTARRAGLDAAHSELDMVGDRDLLIVERFDRRRHGSTIVRVHQEDGCQALGEDPNGRAKYQSDSGAGPSYERLARVLTEHAPDPEHELRKLAQAMTLTVAVGNADGHARNNSFLLEKGAVRLAPIYDVAPTVEFAPSRRSGLWVGGQQDIDQISAVHLTLEARSWGLGRSAEPLVIDTLERLFEAVPSAAEHSKVPTPVVKRMRGRIRGLLRDHRKPG